MFRFALACAAALVLSGCAGGGSSPPSAPPPLPPAQIPDVSLPPSRKGLRFAYFGECGDEVLPSVTTAFITTYGNRNDAWILDRLRAAKEAGCDAILALDYALWDQSKTPWTRKSDGLSMVKTLFDAARAVNVLGTVKILYPIDEPDLQDVSEPDLRLCCAELRGLAVQYPELDGVRLGVIYTGREDFRALDAFDLVGMDDYGQGSAILGDPYSRLQARLRPDQRLIIVPGGADPWREPVGAWYAYAQQTPTVELVCPFIWTNNWGGTANRGISSNGMAQQYGAAAAAIRGAV